MSELLHRSWDATRYAKADTCAMTRQHLPQRARRERSRALPYFPGVQSRPPRHERLCLGFRPAFAAGLKRQHLRNEVRVAQVHTGGMRPGQHDGLPVGPYFQLPHRVSAVRAANAWLLPR
jgi:hypothetical protein